MYQIVVEFDRDCAIAATVTKEGMGAIESCLANSEAKFLCFKDQEENKGWFVKIGDIKTLSVVAVEDDVKCKP